MDVEAIIADVKARPEDQQCDRIAELVRELSATDLMTVLDSFDCDDAVEDSVRCGSAAGVATTREEIEARATSLTPQDDLLKFLSEYDAIGDITFAMRLDRVIAKKVGLTPGDVKKLRLGGRVRTREADTFIVGHDDFRETMDKLRVKLMTTNEVNPHLFRLGNANVRIDVVNRSVTELTMGVLRNELGKIAKFQVPAGPDGEGEMRYNNVACPPDWAQDIYNDEELRFTTLARIADVPYFAADDTLVTEKGYHAGSQVYLIPQERLVISVPDVVTTDDVKSSVESLLIDVYGDLPMVGNYTRAHTLALLLQTAVRELIAGPTPIYGINKPAAGTGGGLYADVFSLIVTGKPCPFSTEKSHGDEVRKHIISVLASGATIFALDNIHGRVEDKALASAVTSGVYSDRELGKNAILECRVRLLWLLVGNGLSFSPEIGRRVVPINLDAGMEDPTQMREKPYRHPLLAEYVIANRSKFVSAILTIIQGWIQAGKPRSSHGRKLASFEAWSAVMGGIVEFCGVEGFLDHGNAVKDWVAGEEGDALKSLVALWYGEFGEDEVLVGGLDSMALPGPTSPMKTLADLVYRHRDTLGELKFMKGRPEAYNGGIGNYLRPKVGNVFDLESGTVRVERVKPRGFRLKKIKD